MGDCTVSTIQSFYQLLPLKSNLIFDIHQNIKDKKKKLAKKVVKFKFLDTSKSL